jgi:uncharacterized protein
MLTSSQDIPVSTAILDSMIQLTTDGQAVLLPVKIVPGASRTRYLGEWEGRARIAVAAPPEKGKANQAVVAYLAKQLGVKRSAVSVVSGQVSPVKMIRIDGITRDAILAAFETNQT